MLPYHLIAQNVHDNYHYFTMKNVVTSYKLLIAVSYLSLDETFL